MKCPNCKETLKEVVKNTENPKRFFSILVCEVCKKKFNSNFDLIFPFLAVSLIGGFLIDLLASFSDNELIENYLGWIFVLIVIGIFIYVKSKPNEMK